MNRNLRQPSDLSGSDWSILGPSNFSGPVLHMEIVVCMIIILATRDLINNLWD